MRGNTVAMEDTTCAEGKLTLQSTREQERHQDHVDRNSVTQVVGLADALPLEPERFVQGDCRFVPWKYVKLELPDTGALGPHDSLVEQSASHTATPVTRGDHQTEIRDVTARRVDITGQRQSGNEVLGVLDDVDGRIGVTADGPQVSPLLRDAPPHVRGQQPRALLAADLARELDKRLGIARLRRANSDHRTTTP